MLTIERRIAADRRDLRESRGLMADLEKTAGDIAVGLTILIAFALGCVSGFAVGGILSHFGLIKW